jgi:hypothetical protein
LLLLGGGTIVSVATANVYNDASCSCANQPDKKLVIFCGHELNGGDGGYCYPNRMYSCPNGKGQKAQGGAFCFNCNFPINENGGKTVHCTQWAEYAKGKILFDTLDCINQFVRQLRQSHLTPT